MMNSDYVDTAIQVRYADVDSLNHVNNATFLTYIEMGRLDFLRKKLGTEFFSRNSILMARMEIDYLSRILLDDSITCRTWVEKVGKTSITFGNTLFKGDGAVCASSRSVAVLVDMSGKKEEVPEEIRKLASQVGSIT